MARAIPIQSIAKHYPVYEHHFQTGIEEFKILMLTISGIRFEHYYGMAYNLVIGHN